MAGVISVGNAETSTPKLSNVFSCFASSKGCLSAVLSDEVLSKGT